MNPFTITDRFVLTDHSQYEVIAKQRSETERKPLRFVLAGENLS